MSAVIMLYLLQLFFDHSETSCSIVIYYFKSVFIPTWQTVTLHAVYSPDLVGLNHFY